VSASSELVAEARRRAEGNLSVYVAESLRWQVLADRCREYLAELDEKFGSLTEAELVAARRLWRDTI